MKDIEVCNESSMVIVMKTFTKMNPLFHVHGCIILASIMLISIRSLIVQTGFLRDKYSIVRSDTDVVISVLA